jgi:hypothetical protein
MKGSGNFAFDALGAVLVAGALIAAAVFLNDFVSRNAGKLAAASGIAQVNCAQAGVNTAVAVACLLRSGPTGASR